MPELGSAAALSTELVDAAFQVYRREPLQFMVALALVYVPWLVIRLAFDINIDPATIPPASTIIIIAVGGVAIYAIAGGVITPIARDVYLDRPVERAGGVSRRRDAARHADRRQCHHRRAHGVREPSSSCFRRCTSSARFSVVRQVIMLEDAGIGRALSRSSELSVGLKMHMLGTLALIILLLLAVNIGAGLLINMIPSRVIINVLSTALSVVVGPIPRRSRRRAVLRPAHPAGGIRRRVSRWSRCRHRGGFGERRLLER